MLDKTFTATIAKGEGDSAWTYVDWPDSADVFGTRKPVKVKGTIDGHAFQATFLPTGNGPHFLPLRAAILKAIQKDVGDTVEVHLTERV